MLSGRAGRFRAAFRRAPCLAFARFDSRRDFFNGLLAHVQNEEDPPDWRLLPDRPAKFFGLEDGFDRIDLKRAYTRWLRRFKPERHPEEFQRIRAAFERLDEQLRYGDPMCDESTRADAPPPLASNAPPTAPVQREDAAALVRRFGPSGARERLRLAVTDDSSLWCALALVVDVVDPKPAAAVRVLIEGARVTRGRQEIMGLLHELLRDALDAKDAANVLVELAEAVATPRRPDGFSAPMYWFLSEHLWCDLVARVEFDDFKALLARCALEVGPTARFGELILLLRVRRLAALRAEDEWLERVDASLTEHLRELPPWCERELDLALWLGRYREVRTTFLAAHPFRAVLDRALAAIVEGDEVRAERAFLEAQLACVERRDELLEAFDGLDEASDIALSILTWWAEERFGRQRLREREDGSTRRVVADFRRRLARRSARTFFGGLIRWMEALMINAAIVFCVIVGLVSALVVGNAWLIVSFCVGGVLVWLDHRGALARPKLALWTPIAKRAHRRCWRPLAARFLAETRVPHSALIGYEAPDDPLPPFATRLLAEDAGLRLYSNAIRSIE